MWKEIKRWLGRTGPRPDEGGEGKKTELEKVPQVGWLADADNKWGVPVLDVRPVTQGMSSWSRDPQCAANAISFLSDDGLGFVNQTPEVTRVTEANLQFPTDGLFDGAIFIPRVMEEKWAMYFHSGRLLCIRSWTRTLVAVADVKVADGLAHFGRLQGAFTDENEDATFTVRLLNYLLRSHALEEVFPAPLPAEPEDLKVAAMWCFNMFGRRAPLAAVAPPAQTPPLNPLRTDSLFHFAVARGDTDAVLAHLKAGVPISLIARDGLPALHWALASRNDRMAGWLLDQGCDVDVRSVEGATALMTAVQSPRPGQVEDLLERKANVNAKDNRGFTALHRAAESGNEEIVRLLLGKGADRSIAAEGHTALSLVEMKQHSAIVQLLR